MLNVISGLLHDGTVAAANSYESIATLSGTGASGVVTFSAIPSTYKHLQLRYIARADTSANDGYITLNGSTNASRRHWLTGDGSSASAGSAANGYIVPSTSTNQSSNVMGVGVIDLLDYTNTNKYKTFRTLAGYDNNGSGYVILFSGLWETTSAVTSLSITTAGGNWTTASSFALYGIKG